MQLGWIKPEDRLPEEGQYTLILVRRPEYVSCPDSVYTSRFRRCAAEGNHRMPFRWAGPGPFQFFGHEVEAWLPLDEILNGLHA